MIFTFNGVDYLFDDDDSHLLDGNYIWSTNREGHLRRGVFIEGVGVRNVSMHRIIMNVTGPSILVDHINRDNTDNRKINLRLTDHLGNSRNVSKWSKPTTSKHKGVSRTKDGKFVMSIRTGTEKGRIRERYDNEDVAGYVYNLNAIKYFGEFASLNDVQSFTQEEITRSRLSKKENTHKTSQYAGISWIEKYQCWLAQFHYKKVRYRVGTYADEQEAYSELLKKKKELGII